MALIASPDAVLIRMRQLLDGNLFNPNFSTKSSLMTVQLAPESNSAVTMLSCNFMVMKGRRSVGLRWWKISRMAALQASVRTVNPSSSLQE